MKYRSEIDGLRAIAVLPVILFHAGFELFRGGFVGVDVFFVISGYLITTILITEISQKKFNLFEFYERRARRILPALFVVIVVSTIFAYALLLPRDLRDYFQSVGAIALFASNFLFWIESGYFDTASELKPMLHTWSLAVEEQYYIIFPLVLLTVWRFGFRFCLYVIGVIAVLSLAIAEWSWRNAPSANFYLLHTRAWELMVGSFGAFLVFHNKIKPNTALANSGLIAIIVSIFAFSSSTPFPSLYTLLPVVGTLFFIVFGGGSSVSASTSLLRSKVLIGIGLVSYSAYLWHQPILAFLKYKTSLHLSLELQISAVFATFLLAYLSYRFIETPFRNRNFLSRRAVLLSSLSVLFLVFLTSVLVATNFGNALTIVREDPYGGVTQTDRVYSSSQFELETNIVVWGDSYAEQLATPLAMALKQDNIGVTSYVKPACPSLLNLIWNDTSRFGMNFPGECQAFNLKTVAFLEDKASISQGIVVLSSNYLWYERGRSGDGGPMLTALESIEAEDTLIWSIQGTVRFLEDHGIIPIIVLTHPYFDNFENELRRDRISTENKSIQISKRFNAEVMSSLDGTTARFIDPASVLCEGHGSNYCSSYNENYNEFIVWYDGDHLSPFASSIVGSKVADIIKEIKLM